MMSKPHIHNVILYNTNNTENDFNNVYVYNNVMFIENNKVSFCPNIAQNVVQDTLKIYYCNKMLPHSNTSGHSLSRWLYYLCILTIR